MNRSGNIFLITILVLSFLFLPSHAFAASKGRIYGQLLDGTNHNAPVVGQSVTLQIAQGGGARDLTKMTTDAHGTFSFSNLDTDSSISYALFTDYEGAQYTSALVQLNKKPVQQVNLTIYEATTSTKNIAIVQATILFQKPDAAKNSVTVSELYVFQNVGMETYVGSLNTGNGTGKPNALLFSLPVGARNVSLSDGFNGYHAIAVNTGFASDAALPPGSSEFSFSFDIPYTSSVYDFRYDVMFPTVELSLLVPTELHATSSALSSQGVTTTNNHPYLLLQTQKLLAGNEVHAEIEGLPVNQALIPSDNSINPTVPWLIAGLLVMLAVLAVTWFLYRSRRQSRSRGKASTGYSKAANGKTSQAAKAASISNKGNSPREQEQALLRELLALDKSFEEGKISKAVYQEKRAKTKARLRALLSEKEAL
ncbi:MAG TPA: carboxypeptidase-like regulatory domain-containing protein [Ktedonobacteraceae bacterium]|nr:carboxypeptidase-like regulatory domain-containing protein [Ktedonobacteraceae bacterium]